MKSHMGSPQSCSETQRTLIKSTCRNWPDCSAAVCKIAFLKTELVLLIFSLRLRSGVECDAARTGRFPANTDSISHADTNRSIYNIQKCFYTAKVKMSLN